MDAERQAVLLQRTPDRPELPLAERRIAIGEHERLLGFLYVGTPRAEQRKPERPARQRFVREWEKPASGA